MAKKESSGPRPEEVSSRMREWWDKQFRKDVESQIAGKFLERIDDPESIFNDLDFLHSLIDDMEEERGEKSTRELRI